MSEQSSVTDIQTITKYVSTLVKGGQHQAARDYIDDAVGKAPDSAALLHLAAQVFNQQGDLQGALAYLTRAIKAMPEQIVFHIDRLYVLDRLNERKQLATALEAATKLAQDNKQYQQQLARFYTQLDQPANALAIIENLLKQHPDDTVLAFDEGLNRWFLGDAKAAEKIIKKVCDNEQAPSMAHYVLALLRKQTKTRNHIDALKERARADQVADTPLWFALAKEYEDLGEHELAFNAASTGNALQKKITPYNEAAELDALQQLTQVARTWNTQGRGNKKTAITPVFVVSMPNSGATLVERYLAAHPNVKSLGEFADFPLLLNEAIASYLAEHSGATRDQALQNLNYTDLGKAYLAKLAEVADGHEFVVDKLPFNFLYCGLIKKALPTAKIIHVQRDALDTCWSIYRTLFSDRYAYAYDQAELGHYYAHYQALMNAWQSTLGDEMLCVDYEAMVSDSAATQQQLLDFCGLTAAPAQDGYVSIATSVTTARGEPMCQKLYTKAKGRASAYSKHLEPLADALAAFK